MSVSRRSFLKGASGVALGGSMAGCLEFLGMAPSSGTQAAAALQISSEVVPSISPDQYADEFDEVVNIVEDFGADPTGEEPIDGPLQMARGQDRLIVFPKGVYRMDHSFRWTGDGKVGLIGQGAVIRHGRVDAINGHVVTEGQYNGGTMMFRFGTSTRPFEGELVFGGFVFDWGWHKDAGMQALNVFVDGTFEIRNIVFNGIHSLGTHGNMRVATATPESHGIVDSIDMRDGGKHYINTINTRETRRYGGYTDELDFGQSWSTTGITGHSQMAGTVHLNNVLCGGWPGSGIYSRGGGRQIITNCHCANSGGTQFRVNESDNWEPVPYLDEVDGELTRDGPYGQTTIEGCLARVDFDPESVHKVQRGIWMQEGTAAIRDTNITIGVEDGRGPGGGYGLGVRRGANACTIENVSIELRAPSDAFHFSIPERSELRNSSVKTVGWETSTADLFSGGMPPMENVTINEEEIA